MSTKQARQPEGIPTGGQFAATAHSDPSIMLTPVAAYDPDEVAQGILKDLRDKPAAWTTELFYDTHNAVRAGTTSYKEFLDGLIAKNHNGRCSRHEFDHLESEFFCRDCHVAFMVEARTNPKPAPVPRGVIHQTRQSPQAMALRFMRATTAERPLLQGVAAVYLDRGEHRDPEPVFGKINNVFSGGWDPSMHFMHTDGREEYVPFDRVVAILETDQSSVYEEK